MSKCAWVRPRAEAEVPQVGVGGRSGEWAGGKGKEEERRGPVVEESLLKEAGISAWSWRVGAKTGRGRRAQGGAGVGAQPFGKWSRGTARADSPACLQFSLLPGDSHFIFGKAACSVTNLFLNKPNPGDGEAWRCLSHSLPRGATPHLRAWPPRAPWGPLSPGLQAALKLF